MVNSLQKYIAKWHVQGYTSLYQNKGVVSDLSMKNFACYFLTGASTSLCSYCNNIFNITSFYMVLPCSLPLVPHLSNVLFYSVAVETINVCQTNC